VQNSYVNSIAQVLLIVATGVLGPALLHKLGNGSMLSGPDSPATRKNPMSYTSFSGNSSLNSQPMTDDHLRRVAPSIFASDKHASRSDRYSYIPTSEIVTAMRREGFQPISAKQGNSRVEGKADFTKHLIRFAKAGTDVVARQIGGLYPELVLVNSHDGTSSYHLMPGMMRCVCLNGLLVSDKAFESLKVHHTGDVVSKVIEGSYSVISDSLKAIETADTWSQIKLNRDETMVMAEAAHVLRFGDADGETETPIKPEQLLRARRSEDRDNSLWVQHNVLQENLIRGGLSAWGRDANNRPRRVTTREVKGIDADVRLNKSLWHLSQRMAELKR
jgi:Domain of unknown function (DUF932)